MNKKLLFYLIGGLSILLAGTAAFFSIAGLAKLFAGAAGAVIIMASALELSKLIIASFLYQYWKSMALTLKSYLIIATVIIMSITSIGIYGFLSAAYQETKNTYDLSATYTDSLNSKKVYYETYVSTYQKQIQQQSDRLNQLNSIRNSQENRLNSQTGSSYQNAKSSRLTDNQISSVTKEIDQLNKVVLQYTDSINKITVAATQAKLKNNLTSDLGPLQFISNILKVQMDSIVNVLILLFIVVFDPLAITLVLAYNFMKVKFEEEESDKIEKEELDPILSKISSIVEESPESPNVEESIIVGESSDVEESPIVKETIPYEEPIISEDPDLSEETFLEEENYEDLSSTLADEEISAIMDEPKSDNIVSGYYGDVLIDGNRVTTEEGGILPVNSNKKREAIDEGSKVSINPMRL